MADASQPCPRFPAKARHATREDALDHQKRLVFKDASTGRSDRSHGLNVYPCEHCGSWHVGHVESLPLVWHYSSGVALDDILESGALEPSQPRAFVRTEDLEEEEIEDWLEGSLSIAAIPLSRTFQNRYRHGYPKWVDVPVPNSTRRIRISREMIERERLLWFSRNEIWEHSIDDPTREELELHSEGFVRFGVPPSCAKLRWADYLQRNKSFKVMGGYFAARADPTQWLATDEPVPIDRIQRTEVYVAGNWIDVHDVEDGAFEEYLAGRRAVYDAARETLKVKMDIWKAKPDLPSKKEKPSSGNSHDALQKYFNMMTSEMGLDEAERIVFEDIFFMMPYAMKQEREEMEKQEKEKEEGGQGR